MNLNRTKLTVFALGCSLATTLAQEKPEQVSPERTRANFGRPVVLAADDVRAFPDAPAGFNNSNLYHFAQRLFITNTDK